MAQAAGAAAAQQQLLLRLHAPLLRVDHDKSSSANDDRNTVKVRKDIL
jgi:hypothetical protein